MPVVPFRSPKCPSLDDKLYDHPTIPNSRHQTWFKNIYLLLPPFPPSHSTATSAPIPPTTPALLFCTFTSTVSLTAGGQWMRYDYCYDCCWEWFSYSTGVTGPCSYCYPCHCGNSFYQSGAGRGAGP